MEFGKRRYRKKHHRRSVSKRKSTRKSRKSIGNYLLSIFKSRGKKSRSRKNLNKPMRSKKHGSFTIKSNKIYLHKKDGKVKSHKLHKNNKGVYFIKNKRKHYIVKSKGHGFGSMPSLNQIMGNYAPATMSIYEQNTGIPPNQFNMQMSNVSPSLISNFNTDVI